MTSRTGPSASCQRALDRRAAAAILATAALFAQAAPARAEASLADKAAAQTLFDEGRRLMSQGRFSEACPKLTESHKLDPGVGTQFNLADCYEHLGQTASAWAGFLEAAAAAKALGQTEREKVARERAAALADRLSKLTLTLAEGAAVAGLEVKRDGTLVGRALWGTPIPVDPGLHVVEAIAPGKSAWRATARVEGDRASIVVSVPPLDDAPTAAPAAARAAPPVARIELEAGSGDGKGGARRLWGAGIAAAGVVGLGVAGAFALQAASKNGDSLDHCGGVQKNLCDEEGVALRESARRSGNAATVAAAVGAGALAAGAVLYLTAPSSPDKGRALLVPSSGVAALGLTFVGAY